MADWTDDEEEKLDTLNEEGLTRAELAEALGRSKDSIKTKLKSRGLTPNTAKEAKPQSVATEAKKQVLRKISVDIAQEATGIHEQITTVGQWIYDNYNTTARSKGLSLVDYVQQAMIFYTNYKDLIERLEDTIKDQEKTIVELTEVLNPVPWRMKIIDSMVAQEATGKIFSEEDIQKYLNAIDYALGKDFVLAPRPEIKEGESAPA